ncbi:putative bifunctional diguanylate cyclase/phosphodiesterase [Novosphingobium sp. JCM 18896]|uniref:putative bifunctional diguanylate cyclase/phosphodiesterase n=1 Tax=Novosphingobium sp. JCM 18896 TaxID=2989731 RepID=UPI002223ED2D|nr:EAL domain-containing protein [Novosphingobium sp. JCM 18896]MCW1430741.1 EAL domain-containing protein [Novosphingobium sp. JCM 18896]
MDGRFSLLKRYRYAADATHFEVAQVAKLQRQIAPLYSLLSLSAASLAFTHRHVAPTVLTLILPALLITACIGRIIRWLMVPTDRQITPAEARIILQRTLVMAGVFAVLFVAWAIALDQYGGPYEQGHVAMFVAVTVLGCVFCLGYHPHAAALVCAIVIGTFLAYCLSKGSEVIAAIAINIALVTGVILKVLRDSFAGFLNLELSQQALEQKRAEAQELSEENALLAQTDPLTGLPNRRFFFAELDRLLAEGDRSFTVALLDLDGFKPVNDTYGHAQGDQLLQIISQRLRQVSAGQMVVARLGGDEFGVLMKLDAQEAVVRGQQFCDIVKEPVPLPEATVVVGCSLGLATYPDAGQTAQGLFDCADFALYHAKEQRRGACVVFSSELEELIRSEQAVDSAFQAADLDRELSVVFQPIFATREIQLVGVEALARWESPQVGTVPPEQLIAAAERVGMARRTTLTLFDKALEGAARLPLDVRLTFNLSALDIADEVTVTSLLDRLARSGIAPQRIVFELTENSLITDLGTARLSLERLRNTGALLALDDFGTGFSSLSTLHELPFDILKIDRSFAARLNDHTGRRLVSAIRGLAETLSLQCVLEGIETEQQLVEATLAGFDYAQGYYLARPGRIEDVVESLEKHRRAA